MEKGQPQRSKFIARRQSYHGNTLGALAVGGNLWRRQPFDPILVDVEHVSPCYVYREKEAGETDEEYGLRVAQELESRLQEVGAENVIGLCRGAGSGCDGGCAGARGRLFQTHSPDL